MNRLKLSQLALGIAIAWFFALLFALLFTSCAPLPHCPPKTMARITFYGPHEDHFGSRIAIGGRAHEGTTMASPKAIAFNTSVSVPALAGVVGNGCFVIQDRGSALEKAYRHGQLRLDVYVASRKRLRQLKYGEPEYMEAEIQ
jgi:hypothetical protein